MSFLLVGLGGFIGSIARFFIASKMNKRLIGTWIANISGSVILAIVFYLHILGQSSGTLWLFLGVGFCGAYTTFSTFGNETISMLLEQKYRSAILYMINTVITALLIVWVIFKVLPLLIP